jgi:glycosyltransferase involved in cell wall biosynthesis
VENKLKILVSCYACSPNHGSEPGMGWQFVRHLAEKHELHVIVEKEKWQYPIEKHLSDNPELSQNLKFYFINKKRNKLLRKLWPPSYYWFYKEWQKEAYSLAKELCSKERFDLVHQLNMVGFREPGYLWELNLPFVWGPIGGMENTPWHMLPSMGLYGSIYYSFRNIINNLHINLLTRPRKAAKRNLNAIIAATPHNASLIKNKWKRDSHVIAEVGLLNTDSIQFKKAPRATDAPLRLVWSGQHTPGKALNLLLLALSKIHDVNFVLDVLGSGTQTNKWKKLAKKLSIDHFINWHGWTEKERAYKIMHSGHVFVITSLKDLTASVTLEALSLGLPIVCLDHCGFSYVVNNTCGVKIALNNQNQVITDLAKALQFLFNNEDKRLALSDGAILRSKDFAWNKKVENIEKIYRNLVNG